MRKAWLISLALMAGGVGAADNPPLTLDAVLALADAPHPDLDRMRSRQAEAQADAQLAASLNDFRITLDGTLRSGRNPNYDDKFHPDNQIRLNARKTLLDGGRQESSIAAARDESTARDLQLLDVRAQRRLTLMARYFDVLLADMEYNADTEYLAVAYVNWDNAKDRQALGQLSKVQLSELENRYADARVLRNDVRRKLRDKRMQLATAMNRPGPVFEDLEDPKLPGNTRKLPEVDSLIERTLAHNPQLLAQRQLLAAASKRLDSIRADNRPSLEFEAETAAWTRDSIGRDEVRAGVNFVWPLWQGGRVDARLAQEQARFHELQAEYDGLQSELRQAVRANWEDIQYLIDSERGAAQVNADYRDLALERARAEYELELKTNLGTSMAETQSARLRKRAVEYRLALAWARLEALLGEPLGAVKVEEKQ